MISNRYCFARWARQSGRRKPIGFELRSTVSIEAAHSPDLSQDPRDGAPWSADFRRCSIPTWKLDSHWAISGAIEVHCGHISRKNLTARIRREDQYPERQYQLLPVLEERFAGSRALASSPRPSVHFFCAMTRQATGSLAFLPATDTTRRGRHSGNGRGASGWTVGTLDMRAQFTTSSPANPRSVFDEDQYGNWTGGCRIHHPPRISCRRVEHIVVRIWIDSIRTISRVKLRHATCPPPATAWIFDGDADRGT